MKGKAMAVNNTEGAMGSDVDEVGIVKNNLQTNKVYPATDCEDKN